MSMRKTLAGKRIVVGLTGSIAAVEMVKVVHALRRRGAEVSVVMSRAATGIVTPDAMTYASGRPAITRLTGMVEHVGFCGDGGTADLLLIAPCTANTLGKIACGIDDTPVTTFATTAIGSEKPVLVVPAMHHSMYRHPAVLENIERLRNWGVTIMEPLIEEGKAKIASPEEIVLFCERELLGKPLSGKKVLITSGPCREKVDDVRVLTTRSSGRMGREIALEAIRLGASVTVVHGDTFPCVSNIHADSAQEMHDQVTRRMEEDRADIYISAAAISDFAPVSFRGKIPSGKRLSLDLVPLSKLLDKVLTLYRPITVAFKLGEDTGEKAKVLQKKGVAMVVLNKPDVMGADGGSFVIMTLQGSCTVSGTKEVAAGAIWAALLDIIRNNGAPPGSKKRGLRMRP